MCQVPLPLSTVVALQDDLSITPLPAYPPHSDPYDLSLQSVASTRSLALAYNPPAVDLHSQPSLLTIQRDRRLDPRGLRQREREEQELLTLSRQKGKAGSGQESQRTTTGLPDLTSPEHFSHTQQMKGNRSLAHPKKPLLS